MSYYTTFFIGVGAAGPLLGGLARGAHRRAAHLRDGRRDRARHGPRLRAAARILPLPPAADLREPGYHPGHRRHAIGRSMTTLAGKTLFITGASRGIGREIALRAARDGANVAVAAKTAEPHPKLAGTIHTRRGRDRGRGRHARSRSSSTCATRRRSARRSQRAAEAFGGIDILVNNASAISLTPTLDTPAKRFDLMIGVNVRATFLCSQACIPCAEEVRQSAHPHPVAAAFHAAEVVRGARRLHDVQVRHEHVHARHGRGAARPTASR